MSNAVTTNPLAAHHPIQRAAAANARRTLLGRSGTDIGAMTSQVSIP